MTPMTTEEWTARTTSTTSTTSTKGAELNMPKAKKHATTTRSIFDVHRQRSFEVWADLDSASILRERQLAEASLSVVDEQIKALSARLSEQRQRRAQLEAVIDGMSDVLARR